jgi:hypothetical protein
MTLVDSIKSKGSNNYFRGSARVTRAGGRGPLQAVAAPLTPRPRGTIYEALPFTLEVLSESPQTECLSEQMQRHYGWRTIVVALPASAMRCANHSSRLISPSRKILGNMSIIGLRLFAVHYLVLRMSQGLRNIFSEHI